MRLGLLTCTFLLVASVCSAETGLNGDARNAFVENAFKVCLRKQMNRTQDEAKLARLAQYCVCYSARLADRLSTSDSRELDDLLLRDRSALDARLKPILNGLAEACAGALQR